MDNLQELYEDTIKDLYNAEKQFLRGMPKLMKAAQSPKLKKLIENHVKQSEGQVKRLEEVAKLGGFKPSGKVCLAASGLVDECNEHLEEGKPGSTLDAAIIACAQKNEHYEICSYGTVAAWAETLGYTDAAKLLQASLEEETQTDLLLSDASKEINKAALEGMAKPSKNGTANSKKREAATASK